MLGTKIRLWVGVPLVGMLTFAPFACNHPSFNATEFHMSQMDESHQAAREHERNMVDNAALQEMSLADIHFVANTTELSGTGVARLDRLAHILEVYGGTVRYETLLTDENTVNGRMEHVREYLSMAGCNMDRVQVKAMMSGGRGIPADQAIRIHERGTQPPTSQRGGSPAGSGNGMGETQSSGKSDSQ